VYYRRKKIMKKIKAYQIKLQEGHAILFINRKHDRHSSKYWSSCVVPEEGINRVDG